VDAAINDAGSSTDVVTIISLYNNDYPEDQENAESEEAGKKEKSRGRLLSRGNCFED
jgi:hypothetical protein